MTRQEFSYRGKKIVIERDHPHAVVSVDGREFYCHFHEAPEGQGLGMWMSDEAFFGSPDIRELARHFADYIYMFNDPRRIVVNEQGEVMDPKRPRPDPDHGKPGGHEGHGSEGGH